MSTERRRNADGGRRRAEGPGDGPRGDGGRRRADGPPPGDQAGGRRRSGSGGGARRGDGGAERPRRPRPPENEARSEGQGGRRRAEGERPRRPEGERRRPEDGDRPRRRPEGDRPRRPEDGDRPRRRPEGDRGGRPEGQRRRPDDEARSGGRRRAGNGPRDPRDRDREHGSRSEGRRAAGRGTRAAAGSGGRGGGGGRRRSRDEEPDDRPWYKRFFAKAWKPALVAFGLMVIGGVGAFAVLYAQAPDRDDLDTRAENDMSATQIMWAAEGDANPEVAVTTGDVTRIAVDYEDIPPEVIDGVLAAEQRTFFDDPGISLTGIGRAILSRGEAGGGSTITQQMARNYYSNLDSDDRIVRKIREIFISIKLGQQLEHEEILEAYLNSIYFGRGASGIEMASQRYFDKSVSELNAEEGAFLGLIIQMPSNFEGNEMGDWTKTYLEDERWPYLQNQLALMNEENPDRGMPRAEAEALQIPERISYDPTSEVEPKFGYVRNAVIQEITERYSDAGITDATIATQGLVVETSLDPALMDAATGAFDVLPGTPDDTMLGLTAVDPATGQIVAFHGGPDVSAVVNNSLEHRTQAGSSYKPYVLATALSNDISLRSMFDGDSPQEFPELESPVQNANGVSHGPVDLIRSTADSVNTPFVEITSRLGAAAVDETAVAAGVDEDQITTSVQGPLVALGTHQVTALDQASAYATFAAGGLHRPAHMVTELRRADGTVVEPNDATEIEQGTQVVSSEVAADVTYAMTQVVEAGGGTNAALPDGRPVAGKTGTSSNAVSAWFVGYTPQLVAAVGLSRGDANLSLEFEGQPQDEIFGGSTSANVWKEFMTTAVEGMPVEQFPQPAYVGADQSFLPTPSPSDEPSEEESEEPSDEPSEDPPCDPSAIDENNPNCEDVEPSPECERWDWECQNGENPDLPEECNGPNPPENCQETPGPGDDPSGEDNFPWGRSNTTENNRMIVLGRDE
ncbi:transglycosylase domain-containing protein [Nocardiopsis sp. CT-R113]|uniref:Transglycosylase domain-containing protein n=1 Tax=Nocardiopsis codii TaxID=3065942 RepID=A0ABU7KC84_9ACTN|nr:transglycosylase domain-containing protein [Nocardiopsis sp. CT-R113]MEE2039797.1 transglycosylase domain-containing protein [Nocardiopsis sp. CT-R113]